MAGTGDDPGDIRGDVRGQIREFLTTRRARISPAAGRAARLRRWPPAGQGPAARGSRPPRRRLDRVLHPPRARHRHRRLRERHRRHHPRTAARRRRAGAPGRPAPHRQPGPPAAPPADPTAGPADGAARAGLDDRHAGVRAQRTTRHPRRQRPRARALLARLRRPDQAAQQRPVRLPGSHTRPSSSASGTRSPTTSSPCCAPRPDAIPTTGSCRT